MIIFDILYAKALPYSRCEQQHSETGWPFSHLHLIFILQAPFIQIMKVTWLLLPGSLDHFSHATLKIWWLPGCEATVSYELYFLYWLSSSVHHSSKTYSVTVPGKKHDDLVSLYIRKLNQSMCYWLFFFISPAASFVFKKLISFFSTNLITFSLWAVCTYSPIYEI